MHRPIVGDGEGGRADARNARNPIVDRSAHGGVLRAGASTVLHGAEAVAAHTATYSKLYPFVRPALVNGAAGAVVAPLAECSR